MQNASAAYVVMSVCLSVTFVDSAKTNKHIFKKISPSSSQATRVFPYQTSWRYSDGNSPNGALNAGVVGGNRDSEPIRLASLRAVNTATGQLLSTQRHQTTVPQVVTLVAGSKRRSLLMAGDDDEMLMTRIKSQFTPKTIAGSDKSVAYVTNNKRLCSTFCNLYH